jgi:hypothetical protein
VTDGRTPPSKLGGHWSSATPIADGAASSQSMASSAFFREEQKRYDHARCRCISRPFNGASLAARCVTPPRNIFVWHDRPRPRNRCRAVALGRKSWLSIGRRPTKSLDSGSVWSNIASDGISAFDSSFCQIVHGLQVHPKFGAGVEEARQTQSCVCRHRALALRDSADSRRRNPQSDRERIDRHS